MTMNARTWTKIFVTFTALLGIASCGSGDSSSVNDLTAAEQTAVSADVMTAMTAAQTNYATAQPTYSLSSNPTRDLTITIPLNGSHNCAVAGHITWAGSVTGVATETTASVSGQVTFHISDPTNNLNDCQVAADVILDGTLYLQFTGDLTGASVSLNGSFTVNSRGPTGGLVPRGSCSVNLAIQRGATRVTGSICGNAVS